jgi:hypothetical protein
MYMRTLVLIFLIGLLGTMSADAKLASIRIDDLIKSANVIVIAKVTNLADEGPSPDPDRHGSIVYADAITTRVLKGSIPKQFRFLAQGGFICSETGAVKDELAMFFLHRSPQGGYSIKAAGNGRMALAQSNGKDYVTATNLIIFPQDAPTVPPLVAMGYEPTSVELAYVEARIRASR